MSRLIIHYHCYDVMQPVDMEILLFTLLAMLTAVVRLVVEFYLYNAKTNMQTANYLSVLTDATNERVACRE